MKTNDYKVFDELIRQKLGDYSETPDMELLDNIHLKKNRIVKLFRLNSMLSMLLIAGLTFFAAFLIYKTNTNSLAQYQSDSGITTSSDKLMYSKGQYNPLNNTNVSYPGLRSPQNQLTPELFKENSSTKPDYSAIEKSSKNATGKADASRITNIPKPALLNNISTGHDPEPLKLKAVSKDSSFRKEEKQTKRPDISCTAKFDFYMSFDGKYVFTNFSEYSADATMNWDFGDGTHSDQNAPVHYYGNKGSYIVSLTITDEDNSCTNTVQKILIHKPASSQKKQDISINGHVTGNGAPVAKTQIKLFVYSKEKGSYLQSTNVFTSMSGEYRFGQIKAGRYLVLAVSDNYRFSSTYWGNTSEINEAQEIQVLEGDESDLEGFDISMIYNKPVNINDGINVSSADTGSDQSLMVFDINNNIIGSVKRDARGNINTNGIPPGNYNLVDPLSGNSSRVTIPVPGSGNETRIDVPNQNITLIPNPAVNDVKFDITAANQDEVEITVIDGRGSIVYHKTQICASGENPMNVDISGFPAGIYYVVVSVGGKQTRSSRLVKMIDDSK